VKTIVKSYSAMNTYIDKVEQAATDAAELGELKALIGAAGLTDMLSAFSPDETATYARTVGKERLNTLLTTTHVCAAALKHYGATMMKTFVGAGETSWTHLVTASLNSQGVISGAHDEAVFNAFLTETGYSIAPGSDAPAVVYKVRYQDGGGTVKGSKTLIQNLKTNKALWQTRFNDAVWRAVNAKTLADGQYTARDAQSRRYGGYYTKGRDEVDTVYPDL
jgi:hypothetical protein